MNRIYTLYAVLVLVVHALLVVAGVDPFAAAVAGDRIPPSELGPGGPRFSPVGFHGGK